MVLAALAKAAAKGGKKAAKAAKASRARKAGDDAYNARRRYQRSAERNKTSPKLFRCLYYLQQGYNE